MAGKALGEADGIGQQRVAHAIDALEQGQLNAVDVLDRQECVRLGLPHEGLCGLEVGALGLARAEAFDGPGDPLEQAGKRLLKVHVAPVAKAIEVAIVAPPSRDKCPSRGDEGP